MTLVWKMIETRHDTAALLARLALGMVMFPHGAQKLLGWFGGPGLGSTIDGMQAQLGLPPFLTVLVVIAEFFGSLGLITGCLTRLSAAGIGAVMIGAVLTVHLQFGFFMNWFGAQAGEGFEYHLLAIGLALALMVSGGGAWSLDHVVASKYRVAP